MMPKKIDPDDRWLWWLNTRDVTPLREDLERPEEKVKKVQQKTALMSQPIQKPPEPARAPFQQKNRATLRKQQIEAEIDLHGFSLHQAWEALDQFFTRARKHGQRTVLVITGKGSLASDQTLRVQVPRWLHEEPLSKHILGYQQSLQRDGGTGAYYVYLRKG